ncbi:hypothetical protein M3P19_09450 [Muricauda sp. 2012CJ35-5]|uniref:Uncharacterized protein n=1 Tax=Flagellimonas spongiicola TaxID=2942208 RepID=A0ABT0PS75_9FLAO|nr:hypothetical protein [Allomuricauda spongiicola]MCL6274235.1 hypothetical protein [Allomuricauda spongiicola]
MKDLIYLSFLLISSIAFSQDKLQGYYADSREKADLVFNKIILNQVNQNCPYVLFSSGNISYLIILDRGTHYTIVRADLDQIDKVEIKKVKNETKPNELLATAFDFSIYKKEFISFHSEFYKEGYEIASGNPTYFVAKDMNRERYGESVLSFFVSPNPIDKKVYRYLAATLLNLN